jgi:hypothetical protein
MTKRLFALSSSLMLLCACGRQPAPAVPTPSVVAHAETGCQDENCTGHHVQTAAAPEQLGATVCGNGLIEVFRLPEKDGRIPITIKLLEGTLADPVTISTGSGQDAVKITAARNADGQYTAALPVTESSKILWITAGQGEKTAQVNFPLKK